MNDINSDGGVYITEIDDEIIIMIYLLLDKCNIDDFPDFQKVDGKNYFKLIYDMETTTISKTDILEIRKIIDDYSMKSLFFNTYLSLRDFFPKLTKDLYTNLKKYSNVQINKRLYEKNNIYNCCFPCS